jgi:phosphate-selective porin OprO/OprP
VSFQGAFHWRKARRRNPGGAVDDIGMPIPVDAPLDAVGWLAQMGWLVPRINLEVVGRYAGMRRLDSSSGELPFRDEVTGALNYYFFSTAFRLAFDYSRVWNADMGPTEGEAVRNGTDRVRLMLQIAF